MKTYNNALLLVGSPKGPLSTSTTLGNYLISRLVEFDFSVEKTYIYKHIKKEEKQKELLLKIEGADLIILAFPLYIDCLPSGVIKALELIRDYRKLKENPKKQRFTVIINCGFPEVEHNNTAVQICRIFAREVGFEWMGALKIGMGGVFIGKTLEERRIIARNILSGFKIGAKALAQGKQIPEEANKIERKPMMPRKIYIGIGNLFWDYQAKQFGVLKKIKNQPYS